MKKKKKFCIEHILTDGLSIKGRLIRQSKVHTNTEIRDLTFFMASLMNNLDVTLLIIYEPKIAENVRIWCFRK